MGYYDSAKNYLIVEAKVVGSIYNDYDNDSAKN